MRTKATKTEAEITENEALMMAQIRELQHIIALMLSGTIDITPPALVADGFTLVNTKMAMHVTGLSRSGIQKLIESRKVRATKSRGKWFIDSSTLPRPH